LFTNPDEIAALIADRLERDSQVLTDHWRSAMPVRHFIVDDLLPASDVEELSAAMPDPEILVLKKSARERKRVGVSVDDYDPAVGAHLFALQHQRVVDAVAAITGLTGTTPDPTLYASGISVMAKGDFLNPHLDNSHDGDQKSYRVLNLLYYVTPAWTLENGGNLEIWDERIRKPVTIHSRFNRLVVMETGPRSWHSVSRVLVDAPRQCVSNYYFSIESPVGKPYRNVTSFRGRPDDPLPRRMFLRADSLILNLVGRMLPWLLTRNQHRLRHDD
jgi:Rps23 Pro-64 3,4-dihydroxylase Tpa1-like proline 4-hydroxylase